jgi:hypothetical protein
MTRLLLLVLFAFLSASLFAQKKKELFADGDVRISYSLTRNSVKLNIQTNGASPSVEVDVNKNGRIDNMLDRAYGLAGGTMDLCAQYMIDERTSTTCGGAPSEAGLTAKNFNYVFTIPKEELTTPIDPSIIKIAVCISRKTGDGWTAKYYPDGGRGFSNVFEIKIK